MAAFPRFGMPGNNAIINELLGDDRSAPPSSYQDRGDVLSSDERPVSGSNPIQAARRAKDVGLVSAAKYTLHVYASRNNTRMSLHRAQGGETIAWASAGTCKFKGVNRASYEAGYQVATRMFEAVAKEKELLAEDGMKSMQIEMFFTGFGQGREATHKALLTPEGTQTREVITKITDRTPIKIGGTRSKKARSI
ncbi:translational machinery component [Heliocybe sulcata]|uniref:Translational machinery component n=1 Tax=Heliocybe sulcata TaxID=5364 RepID=A0A5C3NI58_9AGAM|nr:translational machinery component [Heliocybe sulcata]